MSSAGSSAATRRADYGLDAPGVVRNLAVVAALGLGLFASVATGRWSGLVRLGSQVTLDVSSMGLPLGFTCAAMALYMIWSSKFGKVKGREKLLDQLTWTGRERVLDVGCGRGLLLIGAAKRLTTGSAVGVDIWQSEDLSGNSAEATLANARIEQVEGRVRIETADMRTLPFPDASFDVVVSKAALHNLYDRAEREKALAQIARVLAPGGSALLDDIRHLAEYEAFFRARGLTETRRQGSAALALALAILTWGSLRPGILIVRKPPAAGP